MAAFLSVHKNYQQTSNIYAFFSKIKTAVCSVFVMFLFNSVRYLFVENSTFEGSEGGPNVNHTVSKNGVTLYML